VTEYWVIVSPPNAYIFACVLDETRTLEARGYYAKAC